ncbi:MAG TPA: hypothetical protein PLP27_01135 [Crocinitomicaceae bacterium]|nr:hypothetical protein [Crocinitomicaceae bacterium]
MMKNNKFGVFTIIFIAILFFQSKAFAQNVKAPTGKVCNVNVVGSLNSKEKYSNATGYIMGDIRHDDQVAIKEGTPVVLTVKTKKARGMGTPGKIEITTVSTIDVNNNIVPLTGSYKLEGERKTGKALGLGLGLGLTVLCPFGLFFFCIKGENVQMNSTTIQAVIQ